MISWIPEGHCAIIERFGQFSHVQEAGPYFYIPFADSAKYLKSWGNTANKKGYLIETSEQQTNTPTRHCQTKDNVTIQANTSIGWRILDPKKAAYATDHLPSMISDLALNSLRANIGLLTLNEVFSSRTELNQKISEELHATLANWGVNLSRVEIKELTYTDQIANAMMKEMVAERERKAKIAAAQGEAEAALLNAKAEAEAREIKAMSEANAMVIRAEAEAKAFEVTTQAEKKYLQSLIEELGEEKAYYILEIQKQNEGLGNIAQSPAHKVFLPHNLHTNFHLDN